MHSLSPTIDEKIIGVGYMVSEEYSNISLLCFKCNAMKSNISVIRMKALINYLEEIAKNGLKQFSGNLSYCSTSNKPPYGTTGYIKNLLSRKKSECKAKNIPFNLTYDTLAKLVPDDCKDPILDEVFVKIRLHPNQAELDRLDPTKGYTIGNVHFIPHWANTAKQDATLPELRLVLAYMEQCEAVWSKYQEKAELVRGAFI